MRRAPTNQCYRDHFERPLGDWLSRPLDSITREDVEERFNRVTEKNGWATANQCMSLLRSVYRRPCVDFGGLANPVDLWLAGGGRFHYKPRRKIPPPAEVLPRWRKGCPASGCVSIPRAGRSTSSRRAGRTKPAHGHRPAQRHGPWPRRADAPATCWRVSLQPRAVLARGTGAGAARQTAPARLATYRSQPRRHVRRETAPGRQAARPPASPRNGGLRPLGRRPPRRGCRARRQAHRRGDGRAGRPAVTRRAVRLRPYTALAHFRLRPCGRAEKVAARDAGTGIARAVVGDFDFRYAARSTPCCKRTLDFPLCRVVR